MYREFIYYIHKKFLSSLAEVLQKAASDALSTEELVDIITEYEICRQFLNRADLKKKLLAEPKQRLKERLLLLQYSLPEITKDTLDGNISVWKADGNFD